MNIAAEVSIDTSKEIIDLGEDLAADDWITWINDKPLKNTNAQYLYPHWDPTWDPYESKIHDDHPYANKDAGVKIHDVKEEIKIREELFQTEKLKFMEEKKNLQLEN